MRGASWQNGGMNENLHLPELPESLKLDRPLVVFDLEATGLNKKSDRIISIGILKYLPGEKQPVRKRYLLNPGVPIPAESTRVHGITDEDVKDAPTFAAIAAHLEDLLKDADLAGYNIIGYDIPLLCEEFARAHRPFDVEKRRVLDVQKIFFNKEPRTLEAALRFYCGEEHTDAHDALGDVLATVKVLGGQFARYGDLPTDMAGLDEYCCQKKPEWVDRQGRLKWKNGEVALNFGKFSGKLLREVVPEDPNFVTWLLRSDFPEDTKRIVRDAVNGKYPTL